MNIMICTSHSFFFFLIGNKKILLIIIKKCQTEYIGDVLWGHKIGTKITMIKKNRKERTRKMRKDHTNHRVCKKKELISSKEHSQPSKLLAFLSLQMHHIKQ